MRDIKEIISAIAEINTDRSEDESEKIPLSLETDGFSFNISFCGVAIITSDDDQRFFDGLKNEYEPWKDYISRCIRLHFDEIKKYASKSQKQ
jgi:hypothetical protein